jgi:hypothetical protein
MAPSKNASICHIRSTLPELDRSPGPAAYSTEQSIIAATPRIHMHTRNAPITDGLDPPLRDIRSDGLGGVKYSLRSRVNIANSDMNPAPEYVRPDFGKDGVKPAISPRYSHDFKDETPAPCHYTPHKPLGADGVKSAFHGRAERGPGDFSARSPGPAEYGVSSADAYKNKSPRFTIKSGKYTPARDPPGEYRDLGSTLATPKTVIHVRPSLDPCFK